MGARHGRTMEGLAGPAYHLQSAQWLRRSLDRLVVDSEGLEKTELLRKGLQLSISSDLRRKVLEYLHADITSTGHSGRGVS